MFLILPIILCFAFPKYSLIILLLCVVLTAVIFNKGLFKSLPFWIPIILTILITCVYNLHYI